MDNTKYQITKTVRFKLEPEDVSRVNKQLLKVNDIVLSEYLDADKFTGNKTKEETQLLQQNNAIKALMDDLVVKIDELYNSLCELICLKDDADNYAKDSNGRFKLKHSIAVKKLWATRYASKVRINEYLQQHEQDPRNIDLSLRNDIIAKAFIGSDDELGWFSRIENIKTELNYINKVNKINKDGKNQYPTLIAEDNPIQKYEKQRYHDIALTIGRLNHKNNLDIIKDLIDNIVLPHGDNSGIFFNLLDNLRTSLIDLEYEVNKKNAILLPFQSEGFKTKGGSFNFYTVNKNVKHLDTKIQELENVLNVSCTIRDRKNVVTDLKLTNQDAVDIFMGKDGKTMDETLAMLGIDATQLEQPISLSLKNTYIFLKIWKAKQKSEFIECFTKAYSFTKNGKIVEANQEYDKAKKNRLFQFKKSADFDGFKQLMNEIEDVNADFNKEIQKPDNERNNTLIEQLKDNRTNLKKKRGNIYFSAFANKFKDVYKNLCMTFFNDVAKEYGRKKNKLCNVKAEILEAQNLEYWCVIIEKNKDKYLYMIPRTNGNAFRCRNFLSNSIVENNNGNESVYIFESMTLGGLRKLIFKLEDNTARKGLRRNFPKDEVFDENDFLHENPRNEQERVILLKEALKNIKENVNTIFVDYTNIDALVDENQFTTLDEFEKQLNKTCYIKIRKQANNIGRLLKKRFGAICFKITSQDIEHTAKYNEELAKPHESTIIWDDFWKQQNGYCLRLNPEIKIFWRYSKPSRIHKYGDDDNSDYKNRYKQPQYTVAMVFTQNAHYPKISYSYVNDNPSVTENNPLIGKEYNVKESIKQFNDKFYAAHDIQFALGIDTGINRLAYLTAIDANFMPILFSAIEIKDLAKCKSNKDLNHTIEKINRENGINLPLLKKVYHVEDCPNIFKNEDYFREAFEDYPYSINDWFDVNGQPLDKSLEGNRVYFVMDNSSYFIDKEQYKKIFFINKNLFEKDENYKLLEKEFSDDDINNAFTADYNNIFAETQISSLDLTNAKIVNGKIITNADMKTHVQLSLLKMKRQISRKLITNPDARIDDVSYSDSVKLAFTPSNPGSGTVRTETLFFKGNTKYDCYMTENDIVADLKDFITYKRLELAKIEDNINSYRNAIVANMVGVIMFIYNKLKQDRNTDGYISFEGLSREKISKHFKDFEGSIDIPLRTALLIKLQNGCLVPPVLELHKLSNEDKYICDENGLTDKSIKDFLKTDTKNKYYGVIAFVPEALTSKCCPLCGKRISESGQHGDAMECDDENGCHFVIDDSGNADYSHLNESNILNYLKPFDGEKKTYFSSLNCNDKVAAYNIAKRAIWK